MRLALLFVFSATLSACDFGGSSDDLVGTWTSTRVVSAVLVTSETRQAVPDLTEPAMQPLRVSGAEEIELGYFCSGVQGANDAGTFVADPAQLGGFCTQSPLLIVGEAFIQFGSQSGRFYVTETDSAAFRATATGFSLSPTTLRAPDSGAEVRVEGEMTFPLVRLRRGVPTAVPLGSASSGLDTEAEVVFGAGGSYRLSGREGAGTYSEEGTWSEDGDGRVTLRSFADRNATYRIDGDALELFVPTVILGPRMPPTESTVSPDDTGRRLHAEAGSLSRAVEGTIYRLRRVTGS